MPDVGGFLAEKTRTHRIFFIPEYRFTGPFGIPKLDSS
jgi:hypothetical protein